MSHYIHVTLPDDTELDSYLNRSGNLADLYNALGAENCNAGVSGDGIKEISRSKVEEAKAQYMSVAPHYIFLADVLEESDSETFIFHFS